MNYTDEYDDFQSDSFSGNVEDRFRIPGIALELACNWR